jgi:hypothetical protein
MKRVIPLLLLAAAFAACDDEPAKPASVPTAPAVAPAVASASAAAVDLSGASTICRVYVTERDVAKTQLDAAPTDTLAQRRVKTLDALVKETCN